MFQSSLLFFVALISCSLACKDCPITLGSISNPQCTSGDVLNIAGSGFLAVDASLLKCAFIWSVETGACPAPTLVPATIVSDTAITCIVPAIPVGVAVDLNVAITLDGGLNLSNTLAAVLHTLCYEIRFVANLLFGLTNFVFSLIGLIPAGVTCQPCAGAHPALFGSQCLVVSGAAGLVGGVVNTVIGILGGLLGVVAGTVTVTAASVCSAL